VANTRQTKIKASKRTLDARKPQEVSTKHKQAWINYPQWKETHSKTEKLWEKKNQKGQNKLRMQWRPQNERFQKQTEHKSLINTCNNENKKGNRKDKMIYNI
jgi:hypothetical protein